MAEGYHNDFVKPPSKDLRWQCHICKGILREPVLVTCCGGKFCRICINKWRDRKKLECPLCREKYDIAPEKDLERVLLDKKVLCCHHNQGCQWRGELRKVEKHEKDNCQYVSVDCPYECGDKILRVNMVPHKEKCLKRPQPCEFAIYGCQQMIHFNKKETHHMSHRQYHLTLVLSELKKKERELQKAAASYQKKLHQVEGDLRETKEHCKRTEEDLQQNQVQLDLVQQRWDESKKNLQHTKQELKEVKTQLLQSEESLKKEEQHCRRIEETLRQKLKEKQKLEKEEKIHHTEGKLRKLKSYVLANLIRVRQRDYRQRTGQKCKKKEDEMQLLQGLVVLLCCFLLGIIYNIIQTYG